MLEKIGIVDAAILVGYLLAITVFGSLLTRRKEDLNSYLLGGRNLPWWAVLGSLIATETSTVTFLSIPGVTYANGGNFFFLQLTLGFIIGRWLISIWMMPLYFGGNFFTVYEILGKRFGGGVQKATSILFIVTRCLADGLRLFLTAIVLQEVTGVSLAVSVTTIGILTIIYTVFGGMKSVVWNDCIQLLVYISGAMIALFLIANKLPEGLGGIWEFAQSTDRARFFDTSSDLTKTYTIWSGVIAGVILTFATHGVDQMMVQRYLCAKSEGDAKVALVLSGPLVMAQFALFLFLGVGIAAYYSSYPHEPAFTKNDRVFASFIVNELPIVVKGITLAAVFSAAMSTLSSSLNSLATAVVTDFLDSNQSAKIAHAEENSVKPRSSRLVWQSRLLTVFFGLVQIGVGIYAVNLQSSVIDGVFSIAGFTVGLILGIFLLALLRVKVTSTSAVLGLLLGAGFMLCVKFGTLLPWPWYALVGSTVTILFTLLINILTTGKPVEIQREEI